MGKTIAAIALMISFSSVASARFLDEMTGPASSQSVVKVDPSDVRTYSKLVVKCFAQEKAAKECRDLRRSGAKMTPNQFAAVRNTMVKYINASNDMNKKQIVKQALVKFEKMESHYRRLASANKVAKN